MAVLTWLVRFETWPSRPWSAAVSIVPAVLTRSVSFATSSPEAARISRRALRPSFASESLLQLRSECSSAPSQAAEASVAARSDVAHEISAAAFSSASTLSATSCRLASSRR